MFELLAPPPLLLLVLNGPVLVENEFGLEHSVNADEEVDEIVLAIPGEDISFRVFFDFLLLLLARAGVSSSLVEAVS